MSKKSKVVPVGDEARSPENERVQRFEIVLQDNHDGTYHPGQFVQGHVALTLTHSLVTRGVIVHFSGLTTVHWSEKVAGRGTRCVDTVEYDAVEEYFNVRNYLMEPGPIQAGNHQFPFRFQLSPPLPESYEDNICQIQYSLEARLKQDSFTRNDLFDTHEILLLAPLNLNEIILPDVTLPLFTQQTQPIKRRCHPDEEMTAYMRLERAGYSPGETIHVQADIENNSSREITSAVFNLVEERVYNAEDQVLEHREDITAVKRGSVPPLSTAEWKNVDVPIPIGQLFNVSACKIFTIKYFIEMVVSVASVKEKLTLRAELALGAIPLVRTTLEKPTHQRLQTPTKHHRRPTVAEIEAHRKPEANRAEKQKHQDKIRLPRNEIRQRKKTRHLVQVSEDETDITDYLIHKKQLDRHKQKQGYTVPEEFD